MPAGATTAKRVPVEQICTFQSNSDHCINRHAGGTATGTPLDAWHNGSNDNDFTFFQQFSWCGEPASSGTAKAASCARSATAPG
jgi:hypothetical protein